MSDEEKIIDPENPPKVEYCVENWVRDEQIKLAIKRTIPRLQPVKDLRNEPIALVGFGPSLNDTWEQLKDFKYIMDCSGAHKFIRERGIEPDWHVEVDPREHKVQLIGEPSTKTNYLIASACHPKVFDHLLNAGATVTLWHIFDASDEGWRLLPETEWAITGGCSVGVRMLTLARFLGFTDMHVFGMDGSEDERGKHAAFHPMQPKGHALVTVHGREFKTTSSMFTVAQGIWHELDMLPDVTAKFYGDGLIQHMSKFYERKPPKGKADIGVAKQALSTPEYRELNRKLHEENIYYGVGGKKYKDVVLKLSEKLGTTSVLDYGCGKGFLAKELPFPIWEYDIAIPGKDQSPRPADIVICTDMLEHVEPDCLLAVLSDLKRVTRKIGYFVIHTGPAQKTLPDGRNTHLIQKGKQWWKNRLKAFFDLAPNSIQVKGPELHCVVMAKRSQTKSVAA